MIDSDFLSSTETVSESALPLHGVAIKFKVTLAVQGKSDAFVSVAGGGNAGARLLV